MSTRETSSHAEFDLGLFRTFAAQISDELDHEVLGTVYTGGQDGYDADVFVLLKDLVGDVGQRLQEFTRRQQCLNQAWEPLRKDARASVLDFEDFWTKLVSDHYEDVDACRRGVTLTDNGISAILDLAEQCREDLIAKRLGSTAFQSRLASVVGRDLLGDPGPRMHREDPSAVAQLADVLKEELGEELVSVAALDEPIGQEDDGEATSTGIPILVVLSDLSKGDEMLAHIQRRQAILAQAVNIVFEEKPRIIALHPEGIWQTTLKADYKTVEAIGRAEIVWDRGLLKSIKAAQLHKEKVIERFGEYILAYAIAGSVVQGRAREDSDTDVFVVINNTDARKMTGEELRTKLVQIVVGMASEQAREQPDLPRLNVQTYILTDYWEALRQASPVIFTLLRDGVQLHDPTGIFLAWKQLLANNRIVPSREVAHQLVSAGAEYLNKAQKKLHELVMEDLYYAALNPLQAVLIQMGHRPMSPGETLEQAQSHLVETGLISSEELVTLEELYTTRKGLESGSIDKVDCSNIQSMVDRVSQLVGSTERLFKDLERSATQDLLRDARSRIVHIGRALLGVADKLSDTTSSGLSSADVKRLVQEGHIPESAEEDLLDVVLLPSDTSAPDVDVGEVNNALQKAKHVLDLLYAARFRVYPGAVL